MEALFAHCSAAFSQAGGMFAVFFLGGLTGSLTHCLVMCGPVVACQSACGGSCGKRMNAASQWQYHAGRLLTYGALGFFAALLSKQLATASYWPTISAAMMVMAGGLFLLSAIVPNQHKLLSYAPKNGFLRGVLMSFMPCGLIYAALMMAATLTNPLAGMFAMWLFVLGTIPALLMASDGFRDAVVDTLELGRKAHELFISSNNAGKRRLFNFVFSNLSLKGGELQFSLRKPFDLYIKASNTCEWRTRRD